MQRRPKAIPGPRKVMAHGGGVQTGIDAAEQNFQTRRDHVADGFACGSDKLFFSWLPGLSQTMVSWEVTQSQAVSAETHFVLTRDR